MLPIEEIRRQIRAVKHLPTMPDAAMQLLRLRNDPHATVTHLSEIVESDPSLAAQIIRYAGSAMFNYRGKIESIHDAIARVLGFENTLNIALGLAAGRAFHNPAQGPLGLNAFWHHAVYSAALSQSLASLLPKQMGVKPGLAYLAGLLHNFGFLLTGHLFRKEFTILDQLVEANPELPVTLIEKRALGVDHTIMGNWLMRSWRMPEEINTTVREHHNSAYCGEYAPYANLVFIADQLLGAQGLGDGVRDTLPQSLLTALGLEQSQLNDALERLNSSEAGLNSIIQQLAA